MRIAFVGDISLNDIYNILYEQGVHPFVNAHSFLTKFDYIVGNLECMSEGSEGENLLKAPRLKTKTITLNYLNEIGINIIQLAHNHAYDNLLDGFNKTTSFLEKSGIRYFGAGTDYDAASKPIILNENGLKICLLNYVNKDTNPNLPIDSKVHLNWYDEERILMDITKYKSQCDFVILLFHWGGNVERGRFPDWGQPIEAKKYIDAGADMIVGGHSHTIQPYEVYRGKYIFYSLGNFCFSHFFDEEFNRKSNPFWNCESLIPIIDVNNQCCSVSVFETKVDKNGVVHIHEAKKALLNRIYRIVFSAKIIWKVYYIWLKKIKPWVIFVSSDEMTFRAKKNRVKRNITKLL